LNEFSQEGASLKREIRLIVNGKTYEIEVEPTSTLLQVIRENLELTGTKGGCERGECGACTVLLNGAAVNSCLFPAMEADGKDILTIEGLAVNGQLHILQEKFIELGAILDRNPHPTEAEVRREIAGNYCRCTGYEKIVEAVLASAKQG
jgi:carbon-monoxide dehydrogenase small subunit